jgi:hypothetical protein
MRFMAFYTNDNGTVKPVVGCTGCLADPVIRVFYTIPPLTGEAYYAGGSDDAFKTIEIAAGDIDGALTEEGERRDEIVIAYRKKNKDTGCSVWITALKADTGTSFTVLDTIQTMDTESGQGYSFMSLTLGDYDNDGLLEIAVDYPVDDEHFRLCTFKYDSGTKTLVQKDNLLEQMTPAGDYNQVDLASGDFDGNGADEIAAAFGRCTTNNHDDTTFVCNWVHLYKMDEKLEISRKSSFNGCKDITMTSNKGLAIASGLFKYDPDNNFSMARRQLAMVYLGQKNEKAWAPNIAYLEVDEDLNISTESIAMINALGRTYYDGGEDVACLKPEITAGRFLSLEDKDPTDQIAASWGHTPVYGWHSCMIYNVYKYNPNSGLSSPGYLLGYGFASKEDHLSQSVDYSVYNNTSVPIVAACTQKGESYYLGAPLHIVVPDVKSTLRIIQEPPKHLDYLPDESCQHDKPCDWKIVNVSRYNDFNASFYKSESESVKTVNTSLTTHDIGGSESLTAKFSLGPIGLGNVNMQVSESVALNYESVAKKVNGNYQATKCDTTVVTTDDDFVDYKLMLMDIWRYRIWDEKTKDGKNAFYELILPGKWTYYIIGGREISDYYQPIHENGNVLSYPTYEDSFPSGYDLGSFWCGNNEHNEVMTNSTYLTYGDIATTISVDWIDEVSSSKTTTQEKTLNRSGDLKIGNRTNEIFAANESEFDFSFHDDESSSKSTYSKSETSAEVDVTVNVPGDQEKAYYAFCPLLYTTIDGTLKLAHKVQLAMSPTAKFWSTHYLGQPDPSLNLPYKYWWVETSHQNRVWHVVHVSIPAGPKPDAGPFPLSQRSRSQPEQGKLCCGVPRGWGYHLGAGLCIQLQPGYRYRPLHGSFFLCAP